MQFSETICKIPFVLAAIDNYGCLHNIEHDRIAFTVARRNDSYGMTNFKFNHEYLMIIVAR